MANASLRIVTTEVSSYLKIRLGQVRHGHHLRGKSPMVALTLKERLEMLEKTDPTISFRVNIGFAVPKPSSKKKGEWMSERRERRSDIKFEKQARRGQSSVDLDEARRVWLETCGPSHIRRIADHYGVFQHLFGDAFFFPVLPLNINYRIEEDTFVKVHTGNVIKPVEAKELPWVEYSAEKDSLWTLTMCTPDGNLENSDSEYCHWFLGNIPENKVDLGEQVMDYLRPIPARGAGYYRYIFILYKQAQRLDYTRYKKAQPCLELQARNWNSLEFYREHQEYLTPAGLVFFQSDWDPTVTDFYHSVLDSKEPIFEYDFPKPYLKAQTWFPLREPFNLYLDRYRDSKDVMKEFLLRKLQNVHPFEEPSTPLMYPNACSIDGKVPSWLKVEIQKERLGWGRVNDIK